MRRRRTTLLIRSGSLLGIAALAGVIIGASAGEGVNATGSASAVAVSLTLPGASPIEGGFSGSDALPEASGSFRYPDDGSLISIPSFASSASAGKGTNFSQAVVDIPEASLFGGEVVISGIAARARALAESGAVSVDAAGSAVLAVSLSGQPVALANGQPIPLGDWGSLVVGSSESAGSGTQRQIVVRSVRLTLTAEHAGLPAGTSISLGTAIAELQVEQPAPPTVPTGGTSTGATPTPTPTPSEKPQRAGAPATKSKTGRARPGEPPVFSGPPDIDVKPLLTKQGYVFPIFGQASFSSTLGAARANTGWHHGTDIFAPFGAPVLAIADGKLFSVGCQKVGGFRLWLRDRQGNQFYYAHMAAYSQLAQNGREVRAGQVIGFNGNTGDAQGTPYHVHFEVHPVSLLPMGYDGVVDPYPYLLAWRRVLDVALTVGGGFGSGWAPPVAPTAKAPEPGAYLLQSSDISTASGLEPGALERAAAGLSPNGTDTSLDLSVVCGACTGSRP